MKDSELGKIYTDGEVIFEEGAQGDTMYVIQAGKVAITKKTESGTITIATLQAGEIFGEMALFDKLPRSATARADGDTRILTVDKKKLFATISRDPTLVFKILESMSKRIRRLDEDLAQLRAKKMDMLHMYMDLGEICSLILDEAKNVIKADNGSVMLLDDSGKSLSIKSAFGPESSSKLQLKSGEGIAGDVIKTGRAELVNNVTLDPRFIKGTTHINSILCVPLKIKDETFGVINMSNGSNKLFTIDDLKLLHSLAIYSSVAIQSAKNFSKLTTATDELLRHATMLDVR